MRNPNVKNEVFGASPQDIHELRPFYWVLMSILGVMYLWTLIFGTSVREPPRLILFTVLMAVHAALHWISPTWSTDRRRVSIYLVVQAILAFLITLVAGNQGVTIGLYLALAGEAVGLLEDLRPSVIAVSAFLVIGALSYGLMWGWGSLPWLLLVVLPMAVFVIVYVAMFNRQANARAHAQALLLELETAHRQLSEYATQIEDLTRSAERQRMARELHDTLAQGLAGLILQLEALQAFLERGDTHKAVLIAGQAEDRARAALAQSRQAIDDLRAQAPSTLIEYIRAEAERFSAATGIPCTLRLTNMLSLSTPQQEHARRLVSEGLSNIARHARASHTSISLDALDGAALLQICDDGIGFEPAAVIGQAGHYGLLGLRERARLAGGKLEVVSAAGKGTTLNLKLPLETKS